MCGRIALYDDPGRLARILEASLELDEEWEPHWNVGPTAPILGVSEDREGRRHLAEYRWGLVPPSAKDPSSVRNTFNARAETVATKPIFRAAFQRWRSYPVHSVSKAGVVAVTELLAKTLAPRVRVNAVAPGAVLLPADWDDEAKGRLVASTPLGRLGTPDDVVRAVLFLLENDYLTGTTLVVDGGRLIR